MKMARKKMVLIGTAALVLAGGSWMLLHGHDTTQYQTAPVERGNILSSISATGNANAVVTVLVGSQVSGNIKALHADFNSKVTKGQLIAEIDPQVFQARVDQAKAALDSARSAVSNAQAGVAKAAADVASSRAAAANQNAQVVKAQAAVNDAKSKAAARATLFKEGIMSKEDSDTAQTTYDEAVAEVNATKAQVDASQSAIQAVMAQKTAAETQLRSAQAQVAQAQANLVQANLDLEHTRITAPVDGTVIARNMDVGQTVAASFQAPTIFSIAQDLTKMQVDTNVDEADVGQVKLGQQATFTVDAYPTRTFTGTVSQIRQAPINVQNVVTYDVVVAVPNPDQKLLPGMTASVKIATAEADDVLKIPNAALRYKPANVTFKAPTSVHAAGPRKQPDGRMIWVLGKDGKPKAVRVQLGISDGNFTGVTSGQLQEGDQVIVSASGGNAKAASSGSAPGMRRGPGF
jgi:HlyD family secretion protein